MDSAAVNKEIKSQIRPWLRDTGFSQFTARTAWRYSSAKIDVLNFQSFNSYLAAGIGSTTYSFCVNLGCSFEAIPRYAKVKQKNGLFRPEEYECHFRFALRRAIAQPNLERKDVWYVDPTGNNLAAVIADAKKAISEIGLCWFARFENQREVLRTLREDLEEYPGTHGFGANPSPLRHFMTGFSALSLEQDSLAKESLKQAFDSGILKEFQPSIRAALEAIESKPRS